MSAKEKKITTLAELMELGKKNGKLTSKDIGRFLEVMDFDMDQVDKFYESLETAGIDIIDLANLSSCAFIQTEDMGRLYEAGSSMIEGRIAGSDIRGCNLLVHNM
mgnify:CR=1 FL=1